MGDVVPFLLIAAVLLGSSYIQSVTGFGSGIFAMIFLPSLLLYTEANLLASIISALTSLLVMIAMRKYISFKNIVFPLIGCLVSTYLSVLFIKSQSNSTLSVLLGIALIALSLYFFFFSDKIKIKPTWYAGLIAGVISGVLEGMFSIGGPPVVIYFMQSEEDSDHYLGTISAYFVLSGAISIISKTTAGFFTENVLYGLALGIVGFALGALGGKLTRDKIDPKYVKKLVYGFMALSGIINIITALV